MAIVGIKGMPGESIDSRIADQVQAIIKTYKVKITDGFARTGHAAGGEHPAGLALDIVPDFRRGGTWDDVDRLASEAKKWDAIRWIGYNGVSGHGRGNHLHLSWKGKGSKDGSGVGSILGAAGKAGLNTIFPGAGTALSDDAAGKAADAVAGAAGDVAGATADAIISKVFGALADDGARVLLYIGFVIGGAALALMGVARMMGIKPQDAAALAITKKPAGAAAGGAA